MNKIALAGCGGVGRALLELLHEKKDDLRERYGFEFRVTLVSGHSKGIVMDRNGIDLEALFASLRRTGTFAEVRQAEGTFEELLEESGASALAEATPSNIITGEPGLTHIKAALSRGIDTATTNKGPIAIAFDELHSLALKYGAKLRYEGVVMSGTPLINMLQYGMAGCTVKRLEGILNGTTNFMLTKMEEGLTYDEALAEAQRLGYAETDPAGDVEGWDAAVKVSILAKILFRKDILIGDIPREGITRITPEKIRRAALSGRKIKLLARLDTRDGINTYVSPVELPSSHPLAAIGGATNAVTVITDVLGETTLIGAGAGKRETAQALLSDLIAMDRKN